MPEIENESTTDPAGAPSEQDTGAGGQQGQEQDADYWKRRARQHEDNAKALRDKAKRWDDHEAKSQTEAEKTAKKITDAERRATDAESRALRLEVAHAKGLSPAQAKRLVGGTREELEADADELLSSFKAGGATGNGAAKPDFGGGKRGEDIAGGAGKQWSKADLDGKTPEEINTARKAGQLDRLMGKTT